jgi:SdpC family antimicrobial peptide
MENLMRLSTKASVGAFLLACVTLGCAGADSATFRESVAETKSFYRELDGRTLYRGVIFRDGPASKLMDDAFAKVGLRTVKAAPLDEAQRAEGDRILGELLDRIEKERPNFFAEFKAGMVSGDHNLVSMSLESASDAASAVLANGDDADMGCQKCDVDPGGGGGVVYHQSFAVNQHTALNMDFAVNVHVAYNVDTVKNVSHVYHKSPNPSEGLVRDMLVDELTTSLK